MAAYRPFDLLTTRSVTRRGQRALIDETRGVVRATQAGIVPETGSGATFHVALVFAT
ncbi:hypothetical protein [Georgfuchsia toluolica]|uniref:hypothetical protein n=1 Tax=Georgfuchsia toluolica TaxID=424218 RepID=UPI001C72C463|nr:hypothetical protein [Georgfuchsia toluolica]